MPENAIRRLYGEKLRIRTCGICFSGDGLLLVKHRALTRHGYFYAPPGGGMQYGESAEDCLEREFIEECGLEIEVGSFLFTHEFLRPPLHAIELFFAVEARGGQLITGQDPEMGQGEQIIEQVQYLLPEEIEREKGEQMHHMINLCQNPKDLMKCRGYFKFDDKSLK